MRSARSTRTTLNRRWSLSRLITAVALAATGTSLGACGGSDDAPLKQSGPRVCGKGETQICVGPGACQGGQVCLDDGSGFSDCDCGTNTGGAGGSGGIASDGGGSGGASGASGTAGVSSGGTSGSAATGGTAGTSGSSGTGGSGGVTTTKRCPTRAGTSPMVNVDDEYCLDAYPVTRAEYAAFVAAKNGDMSGQVTECVGNATYEPPDRDSTGLGCVANTTADPTNAVECVDWCDANAYCVWAGKRLCGPRDVPRGSTDLVISELGHACTNRETTGTACGVADCDPVCQLPSREEPPSRSRPNCKGRPPTLDGVFMLGGAVHELHAPCRPAGDGMGPICPLLNAGNDCVITTARRDRTSAAIGFRCCAQPEG